jgi:hypothetical protein
MHAFAGGPREERGHLRMTIKGVRVHEDVHGD